MCSGDGRLMATRSFFHAWSLNEGGELSHSSTKKNQKTNKQKAGQDTLRFGFSGLFVKNFLESSNSCNPCQRFFFAWGWPHQKRFSGACGIFWVSMHWRVQNGCVCKPISWTVWCFGKFKTKQGTFPWVPKFVNHANANTNCPLVGLFQNIVICHLFTQNKHFIQLPQRPSGATR